MSHTAVPGALDSFLEQLSRCLDSESVRRMADFQVDKTVQTRVGQFAERANEGLLTDEERTEYEAFINASDLFTILQLKAQRNLNSGSA